MYTGRINMLYKKYMEDKDKFIHKVVDADELLLDYTTISHSLMTYMDEDTRYKAKELESVVKNEILCRMTQPFYN